LCILFADKLRLQKIFFENRKNHLAFTLRPPTSDNKILAMRITRVFGTLLQAFFPPPSTCFAPKAMLSAHGPVPHCNMQNKLRSSFYLTHPVAHALSNDKNGTTNTYGACLEQNFGVLSRHSFISVIFRQP